MFTMLKKTSKAESLIGTKVKDKEEVRAYVYVLLLGHMLLYVEHTIIIKRNQPN